jgi:hypothetical protein
MKDNEKYWVASRGGVGKSTIKKELERRGRRAVDGDDIEGLASWRDLASGEKVQVDTPDLIDGSAVDWLWDKEKLDELLAAPGELFLCGSAANDLDFFDRFKRVFVLTINPYDHLKRLQDRDSRYGKESAMQQRILAWQQQFVKDALSLGATAIDAARPLENIVDEILSHADDSR